MKLLRNKILLASLFQLLVFLTSVCGQSSSVGIHSTGPKTITRNIIQDKTGAIWMAAFDGIFRYDGKEFTNMTANVSKARFFSLLQDSRGHFWFGSIGSGVYRYNGKTFQQFTTREGLLNNEVTSIFEDKAGRIWFGVSGGASCYDGKTFLNYLIEGDTLKPDRSGKAFTERQAAEVTAILQDNKGRFWFATRINTFVLKDNKISVISHGDKPFRNVRSIIEDKKGTIWLGGSDGLWKYKGSNFTQLTNRFTGYIMEDKKGNIWTSSGKNGNSSEWSLSRYDENSLRNPFPIPTVLANKQMIFGILEAKDGTIWFGDLEGVHFF